MPRFRSVLAFAALAAVLAMATVADARPGSGGSFGSRGIRTYTPPAVTNTAPHPAAPMERTVTPQTRPTPGVAQPAGGGFFGRPGFMGGIFAGFLGAGLLGMLFGGGMFGGLGGLSSIIGLLLQVVLIVIVGRLIWHWWQRRNGLAVAGGPSLRDANPYADSSAGRSAGGAFSPGSSGMASSPIEIAPPDYDAFERLLTDVTVAYGASDLSRLRTLATPEMVSYFADDLARYASRGLINEVGDIKLEQGDLAEAWREGGDDYATVAMRYRLKDAWIDRATDRVVEGSRDVREVTELWTFRRAHGANWVLSAIQQAS
jgi:predicted lipid-binding transport protein (Tim44 family)